MTYGRPPFRADHVGSLPRPPELLLAREKHQNGNLRQIEDCSIRDVVKMQEEMGLQGITDGEYRRTIWHADFLRQIEGVTVKEGVANVVKDFGARILSEPAGSFCIRLREVSCSSVS